MKQRSNRTSITRRTLLKGCAVSPLATLMTTMELPAASELPGSITDVAGVKVGHFTDSRRPTGCTVILTEEGAVGGVDVRGAAPGTRETDLLDPVNMVSVVHAIVLSGGSAFGLDTAGGVMRYLEERNIGFDTRVARVPIVPAAILFDLGVGDAKIRPDAESGYKACRAATSTAPAQGNFGAGAGATVGKLMGPGRAMKGGIGSASIRIPNGPTIGAIVAVNAAGDIVDPATGKVIAGVRSEDGKRIQGVMQAVRKGDLPPSLLGASTTIGVVACDAVLTKSQANKVAQMAQDGVARAVNPAHTMSDGDTIFAVATGKLGKPGNVTLIGALAAEMVSLAILQAVRAARAVNGIPSVNEVS